MTDNQSNGPRVEDLSSKDAEASRNQDADDFVETITAAMPPGMQRGQQMSVDELVKEMNRVPLFMTSLDETDGEGGENVMLEAIKALAYEGTKAEVAENFREQGNEAARLKLWTDAREFYTKAIQTLRGQVKTTTVEEDDPTVKLAEEKHGAVDEQAEAAKERSIEEACLANRALCNLEMKNYGSCNKDCASALRLNPRNIKAWYRAGSACLSLDKIPEALDACTSGLSFSPTNTALQILFRKTQARQTHLAGLEHIRQTREDKARQTRTTLKAALRQRNIPVRETLSPPSMEDASIALADPQDPTSELTFPVLLLYPLHAQTDFIKSFREAETLTHHLEYILPVPWDQEGGYTWNGVECYMETMAGGLIKAGRKLSLLKLLGSGKVEVVDGLVRVFVVPLERSEEWIEQFKMRRGKQ